MIRLENLRAGYAIGGGRYVEAVAGVSLTVADKECLGIAGESGCGKSTLLRLLQGDTDRTLRQLAGSFEATFRDAVTGELRAYTLGEMRELRGDKLAFVPQGALSALNPVLRIIDQLVDALPPRHRQSSRRQIVAELEPLLEEVDLPSRVLSAYPHELSGGMKQRVLIAIAAFANPRVIFADEPTTALDVVVQKKILILLRRLQEQHGNALVLVSHDLGVHFQITDRIAIVYAGKIVEIGPTDEVLQRPRHPYTRALVDALPRVGEVSQRAGLEGAPPPLSAPPSGCRFRTRCPHAFDRCVTEEPVLIERGSVRAACHLLEEEVRHG